MVTVWDEGAVPGGAVRVSTGSPDHGYMVFVVRMLQEIGPEAGVSLFIRSPEGVRHR